MNLRLTCILLLALTSACVGPSPTRLAESEDYLVAVKTLRLPESMAWYTRFAEHTWIDVKNGNEQSWTRIEVSGAYSGVEVDCITAEEAREDDRWSRPVSLLETLSGERAKRAIPRLLELAEAEPDFARLEMTSTGDDSWSVVRHSPQDRDYEAWPGPNSNTFIAALVDSTPELNVEFHHNAVGKDYPRGFRAGITSSGYGLEADAGYLGLGLGIRQGVELHFVQLTLGVSLWPPALKIPFLPRIGIHQGWLSRGSLGEPMRREGLDNQSD